MNVAAAATSRLFVALWPDAEALRTLAAWQSRWAWPQGAALVAPAQLHLTLHFIGATPDERLPELTRALALPMSMLPFEFTLSRAEVWPKGLTVVCPDPVPEAMHALHSQLRDALQRLALPLEARPFRPHVTLARRAKGALPPSDLPRLRWPVRGYALVQSRGGYQTLARYP